MGRLSPVLFAVIFAVSAARVSSAPPGEVVLVKEGVPDPYSTSVLRGSLGELASGIGIKSIVVGNRNKDTPEENSTQRTIGISLKKKEEPSSDNASNNEDIKTDLPTVQQPIKISLLRPPTSVKDEDKLDIQVTQKGEDDVPIKVQFKPKEDEADGTGQNVEIKFAEPDEKKENDDKMKIQITSVPQKKDPKEEVIKIHLKGEENKDGTLDIKVEKPNGDEVKVSGDGVIQVPNDSDEKEIKTIKITPIVNKREEDGGRTIIIDIHGQGNAAKEKDESIKVEVSKDKEEENSEKNVHIAVATPDKEKMQVDVEKKEEDSVKKVGVKENEVITIIVDVKTPEKNEKEIKVVLEEEKKANEEVKVIIKTDEQKKDGEVSVVVKTDESKEDDEVKVTIEKNDEKEKEIKVIIDKEAEKDIGTVVINDDDDKLKVIVKEGDKSNDKAAVVVNIDEDKKVDVKTEKDDEMKITIKDETDPKDEKDEEKQVIVILEDEDDDEIELKIPSDIPSENHFVHHVVHYMAPPQTPGSWSAPYPYPYGIPGYPVAKPPPPKTEPLYVLREGQLSYVGETEPSVISQLAKNPPVAYITPQLALNAPPPVPVYQKVEKMAESESVYVKRDGKFTYVGETIPLSIQKGQKPSLPLVVPSNVHGQSAVPIYPRVGNEPDSKVPPLIIRPPSTVASGPGSKQTELPMQIIPLQSGSGSPYIVPFWLNKARY